jgi:hypothetical protein
MADTFKVTPILVAPLQKSTPQGIPNGDTATIKASINAAVLANSDNDDSGDDEYSYFSEHPNPDLEDHLPRDICGGFISLFVGSRKCQLTYSKARKVDVFYEALTVEKKDKFLGYTHHIHSFNSNSSFPLNKVTSKPVLTRTTATSPSNWSD